MSNDNKSTNDKKLLKCGIIMPISTIDGCSNEHWMEVRSILKEAITDAGFEAHLVSDADDSGIIQKRIVQNIYQNEMIVCDVSCKNANVMFELGMRLAFDKPTIIVMDNMTQYSFDTAPIEHLSYPRDLAYFKIIDFKHQLAEKIKGTYEAAKQPDYTTFLKHFGEFKSVTINPKEVKFQDFITSKLEDLSKQINDIRGLQLRTMDAPIPEDVVARILNNAIDSFCQESKIPKESLNGTTEDSELRHKLFDALSSDKVIRQIYTTPSALRAAINRLIPPF